MSLPPDHRPDAPLREGILGYVKRISIDTSPLRASKDYRRLWFGSVVSYMGSGLTQVAIPFQVYDITGSPAAVGLLGLVELFPLLVLSIVGGAIADAVDRRKMLLITETLMALCTLGLALNASLAEPHLWLIYVLTGGLTSMFALGIPAFRSLTPLLIEKDQLAAASALSGASRTFSSMAGPAVAGVLIGSFGLTTTYLLDAGTFAATLLAIALLRPVPRQPEADKFSFRSVLEGLRFLKGRPVLKGSFIVDLIAMIFGVPVALFPAVAEGLGGPEVLGLLYAAPSAGALLATLISGWTSRAVRHGMIVYVAVCGWGASLIVFGLSDTVWLSLVALAFAGGSDAISAIFRNTILQTATPPHMLGRMSGVEMAVVTSGPSLGDIEAGLLAAMTSVRTSIVTGGIAVLAGVAVMAVALPEFGRYDSKDPTP